MTTTQVQPRHSVECWCCGEQRPAGSVVQLGSHPEVKVCFGCADFLHRRAAKRYDELHPSLAGRARNWTRRPREIAIERGWHHKPGIGPVLRWLGRYVP